jgi:hypothetical protein
MKKQTANHTPLAPDIHTPIAHTPPDPLLRVHRLRGRYGRFEFDLAEHLRRRFRRASTLEREHGVVLLREGRRRVSRGECVEFGA